MAVPHGPGEIVFEFGGSRINSFNVTAKSGGKGTFAPECIIIEVIKYVSQEFTGMLHLHMSLNSAHSFTRNITALKVAVREYFEGS